MFKESYSMKLNKRNQDQGKSKETLETTRHRKFECKCGMVVTQYGDIDKTLKTCSKCNN